MSKHGHVHQTHTAIVRRLKRAGGHLHAIIEMIEHGKPCVTVAQQLHAVEKAVSQAKKTLIHDHLNHCLEESLQASKRAPRRSIVEFKEIAKYL